MVRALSGRPGLTPKVHVTVVEVAAVGTHVTPSMMISLSLAVLEKPVPVNTTLSPPTTDPYLGFIEVKTGVWVVAYVG